MKTRVVEYIFLFSAKYIHPCSDQIKYVYVPIEECCLVGHVRWTDGWWYCWLDPSLDPPDGLPGVMGAEPE